MKRNKFWINAILLVTLSLGGCHKELLEPTPESVLTTTNFFGSAKDIDQAVIGIYSRLQSRKPTDFLLLEIPTDNLYASANTSVSGANALDVLAFAPDNDLVANFWVANYNIIFRANSVLVNIDKPIDYKTGQKEQFIGEAKFMRALSYFELVRLYGKVPKVTTLLSEKEARTTPQASEQEIYDLIKEDLKDAVDKLPLQAAIARGRASKGAAVALLAKVYVYQKDWANAKTYLEQLLGAPYNYSLLPNFRNVLFVEDNAETILALKYVAGSNAHTLSTAFIPNGGAPGITDRGSEVALPSWSLHKKYLAGDTRKAATIAELWRAPNRPTDAMVWYPYINKYAVQHVPSSSGLDLPVIRFADVVLLYAEVLYGLNRPEDALVQINRIRERAFGNNLNNYTLANISTPDAFIDVLLHERQLEFAYENERWFDLVRTGRYTSLTSEERPYNPNTNTALVVPLNNDAKLKYFPIPQTQIDQTAPGTLVQNAGYE
jgi:starch-binding outer membrane protein, SusD/RagB family